MLQFDFGLIKLVGFASGPKPFLLTRPLQAAVSAIIFFASTFCHETVLKETALALRAEGFEYCIDREKRLFACFDRAAEISPHLDKS
jgi:hypothetical protein